MSLARSRTCPSIRTCRWSIRWLALATLTAAADQPCATSLLAALPNQAEVTRIGAEALVVWAHRLYAGPGYWNPLRPDLLAEQHLADTAQLSPLATTAARLAAGQHWEAGLLTQLLAELTRGAPNQPALRAALDELLAAALPRIVHLAVTADHAELADLASLALQLAPQPDLAASLADQMPQHSVQLADLAATLTSQQVTQYRARAIDGQPDAADRLAGSLNNLSVRLADLGRPEEALAAIEEAVTIRRELAAARPDAFRPDLAGSLTNLSNAAGRPGPAGGRAGRDRGSHRHLPGAGRGPPGRVPSRPGPVADQPVGRLGDLGRREEALAAIQEATGIYRELAAARPDAFRPGLATALNNLSLRLGGLGRPEEALAAIQEAVTIRRELAAARPDAFRPDLALSLNNLSNRLGDLGRREDALAASEEATGIYRELAAARPDAFRPRPGRVAEQPVGRLGGLGRAEDALAASEEATGIYRELAAARPDVFRPDLAGSLNNLSIRLAGLGRREDALAAIEEAVTIRRELAAARPDAFRPDLAGSLTNLSVRLGGLGRPEDALAAIEEAAGIYRELAAGPPGRVPPRPGQVAEQPVGPAGRRGPARRTRWRAIREAVTIRRELAAARPDAFRPDLAGSLNTLSVRLGDLGRPEDALAAIRGSRRHLPGAGLRPARTRSAPTWPCR